jgi:hypothetical protein
MSENSKYKRQSEILKSMELDIDLNEIEQKEIDVQKEIVEVNGKMDKLNQQRIKLKGLLQTIDRDVINKCQRSIVEKIETLPNMDDRLETLRMVTSNGLVSTNVSDELRLLWWRKKREGKVYKQYQMTSSQFDEQMIGQYTQQNREVK